MRPSGRIFFVRRSREGKSVAAGKVSLSRPGGKVRRGSDGGACAERRHIARAHGWKLTAGGRRLTAGGRREAEGGRWKVEGGRWKVEGGSRRQEGRQAKGGG